MVRLPKIVRDRLARALGGAPDADHLDPNLLAGYVERSLTSKERNVVLGHLAQCAECREQVSLALPKLEAEMTTQRTAVAPGWLRWPVLRWGLLVASLAIMGTVALVRQPPPGDSQMEGHAKIALRSAVSSPSDVTVGAAPALPPQASRLSKDTNLSNGKRGALAWSNLAAIPRPTQETLSRRASPLAASSNTSNASVSNPPAADWSISASGKVQRSRDSGKSWEELDVDKNVIFRVVFAVGPDIWLGGSKGALYHSTDGGQHWTRVTIMAGTTTVTDDVIHIEFRDAQHGTLGTAAGAYWTTSDAGQHWQKQ
jgi:hypothetical protein